MLSVAALFIVILAGGIVRSTGSGMGCPDWPKCFGRYIPPVEEAQLPTNYRLEYNERQLKKNVHFAKLLNALGYTSLASKITADTSITSYQQEEFNAAKTWTEYINRLIGAITGMLLLLTALYSFCYWKVNKIIVFLSLFNLVLVGFQAWLGSIVVSSNLVPWIVTAHMLIALGILAISIYTLHKSKVMQAGRSIRTKLVVIIVTSFALILDIMQITMGTEVREKIDEYAAKLKGGYRQGWVNAAGAILYDHKNMALMVIIVNIVLYMFIRKNFVKTSVQQQLMSASIIIIMFQAFAGVALSYWGLPPVAQVAHIILASLLFGAQFYLLLNLLKSSETSGAKYGLE